MYRVLSCLYLFFFYSSFTLKKYLNNIIIEEKPYVPEEAKNQQEYICEIKLCLIITLMEKNNL